MGTVYVAPYNFIDWRDMIAPPSILDGVPDDVQALPCNEEHARAAFLKAGWEGDGELGVIWLPPFVFKYPDCQGVCIWHVKQSNNGTSWLLAEEPYDFPGLASHGSTWRPIQVDDLAAA